MKYLKYIVCIFCIVSLGSCSMVKKNSPEKRNSDLTNYYKSWIGTKYCAGGTTRDGVDCSGFVQNVYKDVYGISLPRRSVDMEQAVNSVNSKTDLREGDLVFFQNINGKVNHVGIYLQEDAFVHASTSKGVMVSNLNDKYWRDVYKHGGHHPQINNSKLKKTVVQTPRDKTSIKQNSQKTKRETKQTTKTQNVDFDVQF